MYEFCNKHKNRNTATPVYGLKIGHVHCFAVFLSQRANYIFSR